MKKKYISQKELAEICNCKQPYIAKLKKSGMFEDCLDSNKFLRSKTTEYIKIYEESKDARREPQRQANAIKRDGEIYEASPTILNNNHEIFFDVSYLGDQAQHELNELIELGKTAVHKIQIKDAFIQSKQKENEFKVELGVLIELEEAEALIELVASNMKTKMYNLPHLLKSKYSKTSKEQVDYIYTLIDEAFEEFNKFGLDK